MRSCPTQEQSTDFVCVSLHRMWQSCISGGNQLIGSRQKRPNDAVACWRPLGKAPIFSSASIFCFINNNAAGRGAMTRPTGTVPCNKANLQAPNVSARLADLLIVGLFLLGEWRPNEGLLSSYFRFLCLFMTRRRRIFGPFLFMTEETDKSAMWKYCIRQLFATTY